jgi:hypothetical protein
MADRTLTVDTRVELASAVTVRPGDTLLVAVDRPLSREQAEQYAASLKERMPLVQICVLEAAQLAVYRPEGGIDE